MSHSRRKAYLALTFCAIIWGAAFPVVKPALSFVSPTGFLYLRFFVATLVALPILLSFWFKIRPKASYIIKVLLIESIQLLSLPVLYLGLEQTSALEASLIGATGPIFVILGGIVFLRERESKREWQGLALSLTGSLILILEPLWNGHGFAGSSFVGNLYILLYNLLYTVYALIAKKFYRKSPPLYLGGLIYLEAMVIFAVLLLATGSLPSLSLILTQPAVTVATLYMGIPGSILAFACYLYGASRIEVSEANLFTYLNGIVAIPAAFLLLGETPSLTSLVAVSIVAYGVYRAESHTK